MIGVDPSQALDSLRASLLVRWGRWSGGLVSGRAQAHRVALGLGFLPRMVLILTPRPSLTSNEVRLSETSDLQLMQLAEGVRRLSSGP